MSGGDNLNPQQFPRLFHGSVSELRGTHLLPGGYGGASGAQDEWKHFGQSKENLVSASDNEDTAWNFAYLASGQGLGRTGRPRVYEVEPNAETRIGVEHKDHPINIRENSNGLWGKKPQSAGEHVAPTFKVVAQHDTSPGAQGTFPSIDWRKHVDEKKEGANPFVNHPASARPEYEQQYGEAYRLQNRRRSAEWSAKRDETPQAGLF